MTGMTGALHLRKSWISTNQDVLVDKTGNVPQCRPLIETRDSSLIPLIHPHIIVLVLIVNPEVMLDPLVLSLIAQIVKLTAQEYIADMFLNKNGQ
jgi:hypothetical protein